MFARIHVDHSVRYSNSLIPRTHLQRVEFSADHGVATRSPLQFNLALNRSMGGGAVRMKKHRPMVSFDHGDGASRPQLTFQGNQRVYGPGQMFQDKTNK